jgi:hypothetical protein
MAKDGSREQPGGSLPKRAVDLRHLACATDFLRVPQITLAIPSCQTRGKNVSESTHLTTKILILTAILILIAMGRAVNSFTASSALLYPVQLQLQLLPQGWSKSG